MLAAPPVALGALTFELDRIPWSFVMAFASLGLIFFLFRHRADVFEDFAFSGKEVALLALGSMAGWAVNVPLAVYGGTYLAVNVGGTLVPLLVIGSWIRKGKLRILPALVGTGLVAVTAWKIVEFHPDSGIVARYPTFFLPVVVAFLFALVASVRRPIAGVPVAYASGTLGALIGADLMHVADIRRHFESAAENTIISIGGAGVFDMVFLAGTFAMALHIAVVVGVGPKADPARLAGAATYPPTPLTLRDSRRVHDSFQRIEQPNALERAIAALALSNLALRGGDHARTVRLGWLAVEALLEADGLREHVQNGVPAPLKDDLALLSTRSAHARAHGATLREAGDANTAAKVLVSALAERTGLTHRLEGVA